ncbi:acyltransferase family protein [Inhella gelatinilytica]|uniref:DUF1624 domain-containing protein n=1 Tax=Inhella gelatinilytica TaxID=2795030 RepID=A0A931IZG1_9BURK|nr:heparan-alpha-glucosaminide N-acetyltransferase domain-containing protein [Inhella gelatinilytica]MBH9552631.1 DUF1624 domain-containing protein [Inhella gelatinilytica]
MTSQRLLSLDAFRGFTIAAMLLVNNPGDWGHVYAPLLHAAWHGWTFTDWIFPFFVFISGISMTLSLSRRAALGDDKLKLTLATVRRGALIVLIGLLLNAIPAFDWEALRWPGVLQRLGLCTMFAAPLAVYLGWRGQAGVGLALLMIYTAIMMGIAVPGADGVVRTGSLEKGQDVASYVDRLLMDGHLWAQAKTWDPEGLLSTLPAVVSQIAGLLVGQRLATSSPAGEKTAWLFVGGLALLWAGEVVAAWTMPINKALWTPAYVLAMAGWACLVFGGCHWLLDAQPDAQQRQAWAVRLRPLVDFGLNALFLFVASGLVAKMLAFWKPGGQSLKAWIYGALQATGLAPVNASLAFALGFVLLFYGLAAGMARRGWVIKV